MNMSKCSLYFKSSAQLNLEASANSQGSNNRSCFLTPFFIFESPGMDDVAFKLTADHILIL